MQITRLQLQGNFLLRLATGAGVWRFAILRVQFAAAWAPAPAVRLLRAFQQQDLVALVETVKQRGDFVGQLHVASEAIQRPGRKLPEIMPDTKADCGYAAGVKEPTREQLLTWVKQYRNAAIELEEQRYTELRAMSEAKALRFADALLSIPVANRRRESSGLIEQQAVFQRARKP